MYLCACKCPENRNFPGFITVKVFESKHAENRITDGGTPF